MTTTQYTSGKLDSLLTGIYNTKNWTTSELRQKINELFDFKIKLKETTNNQDDINHIEIYLDYLRHKLTVKSANNQRLLSFIATVFLPLSFVVGFYGMNFKSMGVPTLNKGVFTVKNAELILSIVFFTITIIVFLFYRFYL